MKLKVERPSITFNADNTCNITFKCHKSIISELEATGGEFLSLEVKEWKDSRTLNQNAYFWTLINQLAEKMNDTPNNVYRHFVKDYGVREYVCIQDEAFESLSKKWSSHGIGWFCEELRKGKIDGTTTVILYYGSSVYNTKEMTRLVEAVIESCEENQIATIPMEQFSQLKNEND